MLEEVDTIAEDKRHAKHTEHKVDACSVLMDVVANTKNIIFLATTNFKPRIDTRLTRSG